MAPERRSEPQAAPMARVPPRLAAPITIGALVLAAVHLIWPQLKIDAVTLALLVLAVAPWLGSIFKTIEAPGGWKFEYQQMQAQMTEVQRRVEGVERLLFSGDTTPGLEERLSAVAQRFGRYLREVDTAFDVPPPSVALRSGLDNAQYDQQLNQIQLDPLYADDDYAMLREYAHHVMLVTGPAWDDIPLAIESGLADYFVAGFTGDPRLGPELARRLRERRGTTPASPWIRNLDNQRSFDASSGPDVPQVAGEVWGGAFWQLRDHLGPSVADRVLARTWIEHPWRGRSRPESAFVEALLGRLAAPERQVVRDVFATRGLSVSATPAGSHTEKG